MKSGHIKTSSEPTRKGRPLPTMSGTLHASQPIQLAIEKVEAKLEAILSTLGSPGVATTAALSDIYNALEYFSTLKTSSSAYKYENDLTLHAATYFFQYQSTLKLLSACNTSLKRRIYTLAASCLKGTDATYKKHIKIKKSFHTYDTPHLNWLIICKPEEAYAFIKANLQKHSFTPKDLLNLLDEYLRHFATAENRKTVCDQFYKDIIKPYFNRLFDVTCTITIDSSEQHSKKIDDFSSRLELAIQCEQSIEEIKAIYQEQCQQKKIIQAHCLQIQNETQQKIGFHFNLYTPAYYTSILTLAMQCPNTTLAQAYFDLFAPLADENKQNALYQAIKHDHIAIAESFIDDYIKNGNKGIFKKITDNIVYHQETILSDSIFEIKTILHLIIEKNLIHLLKKLFEIGGTLSQLLSSDCAIGVFVNHYRKLNYFPYAVITNKMAATFMIPYIEPKHFWDLLTGFNLEKSSNSMFFHDEKYIEASQKLYAYTCAFIAREAEAILTQAGKLYNQEEHELPAHVSLLKTLFFILIAKIQAHDFKVIKGREYTLINKKVVPSTAYQLFNLICDQKTLKDGGINVINKDMIKIAEQIMTLLTEAINNNPIASFLTPAFMQDPVSTTEFYQDLLKDILFYKKILKESPRHTNHSPIAAGNPSIQQHQQLDSKIHTL